MFTGLVEEVGSVKELRRLGGGARITVASARLSGGLETGDSVAVNGVCLTVAERGGGSFTADVSEESLARSTLGGLARGASVNLERALCLGARLGGHIVQGHVDGMGSVKSVAESGEGRVFTFAVPADIEDYLVEKGSIAVDGISLTISALEEGEFSVSAIPHTVAETNLKGLRAGDAVNLEVDIIAKYVRRYMERGMPVPEKPGGGGSSLEEKLAEGGFL